MAGYEETLFKERQYLREFWVWAVFAAIIITNLSIYFYLIYSKLVEDGLLWNQSFAFYTGIMLGLGVLLPLFLSRMRLELTVYPGRIEYRFWPWQVRNRVISVERIASWERVDIRPIRDYGGLGIRRGAGGWAYIAKGGGGVRLKLRGGKSIVFSSGDPAALILAIENAISRYTA